MNLREGIKNTIDILVTEKGVPFTGDVSFGIYDNEGEVIFHKDYYSESGLITVNLPPIHQNDYVFSLETDNGYTDPKEVKVMKSLKGSDQKRKMKVDIDQERDAEISNTEELLNAFYIENGNRIKNIETSITDAETRSGLMKKEIVEKIKKVDEKVKKTDTKINTIQYNLENKIDKELETVSETIQQVVNDTNVGISILSKEIEKNSRDNGLFVSEKIKEIKQIIPKGKILQYEVDDNKIDDKTLWTSEKINKEVKQMKKKVKEVGNYGGGGASYFVDLGDAPTTYSGQAGKIVKVNATEDGLEFGVGGGGSIDGSGTANELSYRTDSDTLGSLAVATYPSLAELARVKGVTSAIQTQIDSKQASDAQLTSLAGLSYTGNALKGIRVNAGETDFELATIVGGTTTQMQYNNAGVFGGMRTVYTEPSSTLTYIQNAHLSDLYILGHTASNAVIDGSGGKFVFTRTSVTGSGNGISGGAVNLSGGSVVSTDDSLITSFVGANSGGFSLNAGTFDGSIGDARGGYLTILGGKYKSSVYTGGNVTLGAGTADTGAGSVVNGTLSFLQGDNLYRFSKDTGTYYLSFSTALLTANRTQSVPDAAGTYVLLEAGQTFTADISVPDEAYDATGWNGNLEVPTKNAIRDKIESMGGGGNVSKVGTPVNNQIAVWTGDGTVEGTTAFKWDNGSYTMTLGVETQTALIAGADATTADTDGTNIEIRSGAGNGTGASGNFYLATPTDVGVYFDDDIWQSFSSDLTYQFYGNNFLGILDMSGVNTSDKTFAFPNQSGTIALLSDISGSTGITRTVVTTSGSITLGATVSVDYVYFVAGAHTLSMPSPNTNRYTIKNNHSANITIDTAGAENIEGAASISIAPQEAVDVVSDGTNWFVV